MNKTLKFLFSFFFKCFPGGSHGKGSACNVKDSGSIPGSGKFPGEGNSSILGKRIPWTEEPAWTTVHGIAKSDYTDTHMCVCVCVCVYTLVT